MVHVDLLADAGPKLEEIPRALWPESARDWDPAPVRVLLSKRFLVQQFAPHRGWVRLSICRTKKKGARWQDGITWDELQQLKREAGWGDADAVEVFPRDQDLVNVANMRHLWIPSERLAFAWRRPEEEGGA